MTETDAERNGELAELEDRLRAVELALARHQAISDERWQSAERARMLMIRWIQIGVASVIPALALAALIGRR